LCVDLSALFRSLVRTIVQEMFSTTVTMATTGSRCCTPTGIGGGVAVASVTTVTAVAMTGIGTLSGSRSCGGTAMFAWGIVLPSLELTVGLDEPLPLVDETECQEE
jgi:hypothetical protein